MPVVREEDRLTAFTHGGRKLEGCLGAGVVERLVDIVGDER